MSQRASLNEDVRRCLSTQKETFGGSYANFPACLQRAVAILDAQPAEFTHRFNVSLSPRKLGGNISQNFLGLLDDQIGFLGAIVFITCLKLGELAIGIVEALNIGQFRIVVMCA